MAVLFQENITRASATIAFDTCLIQAETHNLLPRRRGRRNNVVVIHPLPGSSGLPRQGKPTKTKTGPRKWCWNLAPKYRQHIRTREEESKLRCRKTPPLFQSMLAHLLTKLSLVNVLGYSHASNAPAPARAESANSNCII